MTEESQQEMFEEGTVTLDPEMKAKEEAQKKFYEEKTEEMRTTNKMISAFIEEMSDKFDIKLMVSVHSNKYDEFGIWKSKNMNTLDEMGLCKLIQNQY